MRSASAARSAAWRLPRLSPPSAPATSSVPIRATSRIGAPSASSTAALAAAIVAPQPSASKPASVTTAPLDREVQAHDVPAGGRPAVAGMRPGGHVSAPVREPQMLLESLVRHAAGV